MTDGRLRHVVGGFAAALALFIGVIVASGAGWNPTGIKWNFSSSGQFGDSFGFLSAVMASIAAVSAFAAFSLQRREISNLRRREGAEDKIADKRDFERTFFSLLQLFRETVKEIDVVDHYSSGGTKTGRDVVSHLLNLVRTRMNRPQQMDDAAAYRLMYTTFKDDIAHYFRLFYHILKLVNSSRIEDKAFYTRLLRATLSDAEITIIALNCIYGGGVEKLKPLVEQYAMLHNISSQSAKQWKIVPAFLPSAFGDREIQEDGTLEP